MKKIKEIRQCAKCGKAYFDKDAIFDEETSHMVCPFCKHISYSRGFLDNAGFQYWQGKEIPISK